MKRTYFLAVAFCASALFVNAQDSADGKKPRGQGNPIIAALDANHDGTLDEQEINNAPAALRKLDKNGDGKITRQELRPANAAAKPAGAAAGENGRKGKKAKKDKSN